MTAQFPTFYDVVLGPIEALRRARRIYGGGDINVGQKHLSGTARLGLVEYGSGAAGAGERYTQLFRRSDGAGAFALATFRERLMVKPASKSRGK